MSQVESLQLSKHLSSRHSPDARETTLSVPSRTLRYFAEQPNTRNRASLMSVLLFAASGLTTGHYLFLKGLGSQSCGGSFCLRYSTTYLDYLAQLELLTGRSTLTEICRKQDSCASNNLSFHAGTGLGYSKCQTFTCLWQ